MQGAGGGICLTSPNVLYFLSDALLPAFSLLLVLLPGAFISGLLAQVLLKGSNGVFIPAVLGQPFPGRVLVSGVSYRPALPLPSKELLPPYEAQRSSLLGGTAAKLFERHTCSPAVHATP